MFCDKLKEYLASTTMAKEDIESLIVDIEKHIEECRLCQKNGLNICYFEKKIKEKLDIINPDKDFQARIEKMLRDCVK